MNILVLNSGSSSIKFSIYETQPDGDPKPIMDAELSGIGTDHAKLKRDDTEQSVDALSEEEAVQLVLEQISQSGTAEVRAVGYRIVHPGPKIDRHLLIDAGVLQQLEASIEFAPLHLPEAIKLIRKVMQHLPEIPHFACFDTIFHQTMPEWVKTCPIPLGFRDQGVRRYGFHGLSCESVVRQLRAAGIDPQRMVIAHLGSGCSVTATHQGRSVENTMGLTPTGGVVMGTRPGDLDPGLLFYLLRQPGATIDSVEHMLNHDSGLKALFGVNDMRKLREADSPAARMSLQIFSASVRKAIAGLCSVHGADAIVFTGGIGEHDPKTRLSIADRLFTNQPELDESRNNSKDGGVRTISTEASTIPVYVVPADEDLMIAVHVVALVASGRSDRCHTPLTQQA